MPFRGILPIGPLIISRLLALLIALLIALSILLSIPLLTARLLLTSP